VERTWSDEDLAYAESEKARVYAPPPTPREARKVDPLEVPVGRDPETGAWTDEPPTPTLADIITALRAFTRRSVYREHAGGGLMYLEAEVDDQGSYVWFGWSDKDHGDYGLALEETMAEAGVVQGCLYKRNSETYATLEDEPVTDAGLRVAALKFVAKAMVAAFDPATEWTS